MSATTQVVLTSVQQPPLPSTPLRLTPIRTVDPTFSCTAGININLNLNTIESADVPALVKGPSIACDVTSDGPDSQEQPAKAAESPVTSAPTTISPSSPQPPVQRPTAVKRTHHTADATTAANPPSAGSRACPAKRQRDSGRLAAATKKLFIYGNYDRYYGYRNTPSSAAVVIGCASEFADIRLDAFAAHPNLFEAADCLDIGCNRGSISMAVAARLGARSMVGIDIDQQLIARARQTLAAEKKRLAIGTTAMQRYPNNVYFKHGNYVLGDEALLALERPQFDTILALSITKWLQLNFGDAGVKRAFRRMFAQLRCGGRMVMEAQPWSSYKRRKRLTPEIERHFGEIRLRPEQFGEYLLGEEVGFVSAWRMEVPRRHEQAGFRREIWVFEKAMPKMTVAVEAAVEQKED